MLGLGGQQTTTAAKRGESLTACLVVVGNGHIIVNSGLDETTEKVCNADRVELRYYTGAGQLIVFSDI